jgi:hypothetical protein
MNTRHNSAPLIVAIVLLLLPVVYAGSYVALVTPQRVVMNPGLCGPVAEYHDYRFSNFEKIFWPLEQIDRKVRPGAWELLETETIPLNSR